MSAELDYLTGYGDELLAACREQVDTLRVTRFGPVNASGRLKRELRREAVETASGYSLRIYAPGYVLTMLFGRQPGKFPNLTDIKQWIEDKGIVPHPGKNGKTISTDTLAYLIGRKIANAGNVVHQQGPPSQLFATVLDPVQVMETIKAHFVLLLVQRVVSALRESLLS